MDACSPLVAIGISLTPSWLHPSLRTLKVYVVTTLVGLAFIGRTAWSALRTRIAL